MVHETKHVAQDATNNSQPLEQSHAPPRVAPRFHERGFYEGVVKPIFERIIAITLSILSLPLVLLIIPGIWMTIGAPAIYRQQRVGLLGREFTVYKFRTMEADRRIAAPTVIHPERRQNHKSENDPRHFPYGRFLRKWSLDEIPQFWNIALGKMALVGPRPELPHIVAGYENWQHRRHEVKPGLTGLWQVTARGDTPMHEATDIDIEYVETVTFHGDLRILLCTPAAVLGRRQGH